MPHRIYETEAFLLSSVPTGEADRQMLLYTSEFGLVRATAQGVRELKSKLRYSLQPYSLSVVNLVRGRAGWRLTNARLEGNYYQRFRGDHVRLTILAHIFSLLRRMLHGEERHPELFTVLSEGLDFLGSAPNASLSEVELVLVLRLLHCLGYVGNFPEQAPLLATSPWDKQLLEQAARYRAALVTSVNESLRASHL